MRSNLTIKTFTGPEAYKYSEKIIDLAVFIHKDFPYLYEDSADTMKNYLETYFKSPNSRFFLVFKEEEMVGFSNIIPLNEEIGSIKQTFHDKKINISQYLYIGECIILPQYREIDIIRKFVYFYEQYAKEKNYTDIVFMTVIRSKDHPLRPLNYRGLEPIWKYFGYKILEDTYIKVSWRMTDTHQKEENILNVWHKKL